MKLSQFSIGMEFYSKGWSGHWKCIDIGNEHIIAIRLDTFFGEVNTKKYTLGLDELGELDELPLDKQAITINAQKYFLEKQKEANETKER